jgi:FtsZ-binding cell division protein ZapB
MNQLETNLEEKISANIQTVLKTHIETEVGKVKQELKDDINSMKRKIENAQKSYDNLVSEKRDEDSAANIRNNVINKTLEYVGLFCR